MKTLVQQLSIGALIVFVSTVFQNCYPTTRGITGVSGTTNLESHAPAPSPSPTPAPSPLPLPGPSPGPLNPPVYPTLSVLSNDVLWSQNYVADNNVYTVYSSQYFATSANDRGTFLAAYCAATAVPVSKVILTARM